MSKQLNKETMEWSTINQVQELQIGDIIRHASLDGARYIVTGVYGGRVTAVKTVDVTNPAEWHVLIRDDKDR